GRVRDRFPLALVAGIRAANAVIQIAEKALAGRIGVAARVTFLAARIARIHTAIGTAPEECVAEFAALPWPAGSDRSGRQTRRRGCTAAARAAGLGDAIVHAELLPGTRRRWRRIRGAVHNRHGRRSLVRLVIRGRRRFRYGRRRWR